MNLLRKMMLKLVSDRYCENSPTAQCEDNPIPVVRDRHISSENSLNGNSFDLTCFDYHCLYCNKLIHTYVE